MISFPIEGQISNCFVSLIFAVYLFVYVVYGNVFLAIKLFWIWIWINEEITLLYIIWLFIWDANYHHHQQQQQQQQQQQHNYHHIIIIIVLLTAALFIHMISCTYDNQLPGKWRDKWLQTLNWYLSNKANLRDLIAATSQVISNWIQIVNFSARVTVKFDGWPRKIIGHFFYTTSSFVHHFKSIGEFKLDLQSRNAQFGSQLVTCYPVWPWNLINDLGKQ